MRKKNRIEELQEIDYETLRLNENISNLCSMSDFGVRNFEFSGPVLRELWIFTNTTVNLFLTSLRFLRLYMGD
jgi:hypothetical protein